MQQLERAILSELRYVAGNPALRHRDIVAWSTGQLVATEPELLVRLPQLRLNVVYVDPSVLSEARRKSRTPKPPTPRSES